MCTMFDATGVAGKPNSFFRQKSLTECMEDWGLLGEVDIADPKFTADYFAAMLTEGRGGTPVFGLRLMGPDLAFACEWLRCRHPGLPSDLARFATAFGPLRFIHLSRQDKLGEAVSYLRAQQTGLWHQYADGSAMEQLKPTEKDGFDADAITERMDMLKTYDAQWPDWFAAQGIDPLKLSYEELADDPQGVVAKVLDFIGQDPDLAKTLKPGLRKLADETSAAWIARYRRLFPNC